MISFPKLECWNSMTKMATVAAEVDKKRVLCRVSYESLRTKFGVSEDMLMHSVIVRHRTDIQEAARKIIERDDYESDGSVLIKTSDL